MEVNAGGVVARGWQCLVRWFDNDAGKAGCSGSATSDRRIDWPRVVPFLALHLACGVVFLVGTSKAAIAVAAALYVLRMFAITGFYHRYFSHRTFKTSRWGQFLFALLGACAVQRGPLW